MSLAVSVTHRQGSFALDVNFESHGRLTAIFGASGSGKTSLVNVIAGLVRPEHALITVNGVTLTDTARGIALPVHRRRVGYVFQDARLFPHLSVARNLDYGRWFAPKQDRYADREQILSLLGIAHLLPRKPGQLSGGEKQRVAIGRALLASPKLLLMDEPLASLDGARKAEILPYIERLRDELAIPTIYVSHSVAEVYRLATDIVVLSEGRLVAAGPAHEIAARLDLVPAGERDEGGVILDMTAASYEERFDMTLLISAAGKAHVQGRVTGTVRVRIRARDVMIATAEPEHISALNIFRGVVAGIAEADRSSVHVAIDCAGSTIMARITRKSCGALDLAPGVTAYAVVKAVSVSAPGSVPARFIAD